LKLGVYSLVTPDYEVDEAAALVAEIGYEGIEWPVDYPSAAWDGVSKWHISTDDLEVSAAAAREAAERNGLAIPVLGAPCDFLDEEGVRRYMQVAVMVGASAVRIKPPRYDGSAHFGEVFEKTRAACEAAQRMASETGIRALVELHGGRIAPSASAARRLLEGRDPRWMGAVFDPGNMVREGMENWRMGIEILGPYLQHVHVKDGAWVRAEEGTWRMDHASLAEGLVDWHAVMDGLRSAAYEGFLNIEDFRTDISTRHKLQEDYDYLTSLL
jgi:sugar phosphate isomerase/epimerase